MRNNIQAIKEKLQELKFKKKSLEQKQKELELQIKNLEEEERQTDLLLKIIQEVADVVMQNVTGTVSSLTTSALQAVFGPNLEFKAEIVQQRGRPNVELVLYDDGHPLNPLESAGGGVADLISFALRLTFWGLHKNLRPIIILDEPFKFVSSDLQPYCSLLLRELHKKLGVQFIIISHLPALIENADAIFEVRRRDGKSYVKKIFEKETG